MNADRSQLQLNAYSHALVAPIRIGSDSSSIVGRYQSGIYDETGSPICNSQLERTYGPISVEGLFREEQAVRDAVIYAGLWDRHYGHFITEALSRCWAAEIFPGISIAWSIPEGSPAPPALLPWQNDILELLNIRDNILFVSKPTRFDTVIVPDSGFRIRGIYHQQHASYLARLDHDPLPSKKTWISRRLFDSDKSSSQIQQIESFLIDQGWNVIHPQDMTFIQQLEAYRSSERIAGLASSAFHSLMFLKKPFSLQVDIFARSYTSNAIAILENFAPAPIVQGFSQRIHTKPVASGPPIDHQSPNAPLIRETLSSSGGVRVQSSSSSIIKTSIPMPQTVAARRINQILDLHESRRYLEIGVANGNTFFSIKASKRVAVDPQFRFDYKSLESPGTSFFEMTSNCYFNIAASEGHVFDVIYIDGLHTFQQTFRDFCASQALAHAKTVWLIDDTWPNDVFSTLRTHRDAVNMRKEAGKQGSEWHGDTYQVVLAIHDYFPNVRIVSYAGGPRQTVCYRGVRPFSSPRFEYIEDIERTSYFDLSGVEALYNFQDESFVYDELLSFFSC